MKSVFYLDGGAGRIIAAIPALLKYARLNPTVDFAVIVYGWDFLFWGIPELQDRTYNADTKGVFDNVVKSCDVVYTPEPYRLPDYFNQKISLVQGFDRCINSTTDHSDLGVPSLVFNQQEILVAKNTIATHKSPNKSKTIVIQPFGRGAKVENTIIYDEESRSLSAADYMKLASKLFNKYNLIFFGEPAFQIEKDTYSAKFTCDLRQWGALIAEADYFIGCDSVGQHMARAVGTPGTVIFGSTYPINTSYPDYFHIIEKEGVKKYAPIRIAGLDISLANRLNESCMKFTDKELVDIYNSIVSKIEKLK
jgi:hypothetical protein